MLDSYLLNRVYCSWKWLQERASTFHMSELFTYILKPGSVDLWPMTPLAESLKQSWSGRFIKQIHLLCRNSHVIKQYLYTWGRSEWTWRPLILRSRIVIKRNGKLDQAETDRSIKTLITTDSDSMALEILHRLSEEQGRFCYFGERRFSNIWDTGLGSSPLSVWKAEGLSDESQGPHRQKCIGHSSKGASPINSWILAAAFSHPLLLSIWL